MKDTSPENYGLAGGGYSISALLFDGIAKIQKKVFNKDGQWDGALPQYEAQCLTSGEDTNGCTVWGWQNAIEIFEKYVYKIDKNYSERYTYNVAGISGNGAVPSVIGATIQETGLIDESEMPFVDTYEKFIQPRPMTLQYLSLGKKWCSKYRFDFDYVYSYKMRDKNKRIELMKEHLQYSPLCISVSAWYFEGVSQTFVDGGYENNHWCVCYGYDERGWKVFDSYDNSRKIVSYNHNIGVCMWFVLPKKIQFIDYLISLFNANK